MKQGSASRDGRAGWKAEPRSRAVSETAVSQIGSSMGNHVTEVGMKMNKWGASKPLYEGRGYEAPMAGKHSYPSGSQRRS